MKSFGRQTVLYVAIVAASAGAAMVASLVFPIGTPIAHQDFYAAAAQVIPVMLLAALVRISSLRDAALVDFKAVEAERKRLLQRTQKLRAEPPASTTAAEAGLEDRLDRIEEKLKTGRKEVEASPVSELGQVLAGVLIVTLVMGAVGIGTALAALGQHSDSGPLFFGTLLSVAWILLGLLYLEITHYWLTGHLGAR